MMDLLAYIRNEPDDVAAAVLSLWMPRFSSSSSRGEAHMQALVSVAAGSDKPRTLSLFLAHACTPAHPLPSGMLFHMDDISGVATRVALREDCRRVISEVIMPSLMVSGQRHAAFRYILTYGSMDMFIWYCTTYWHCKECPGFIDASEGTPVELEEKIKWMHASGKWEESFWLAWFENAAGVAYHLQGEPHEELTQDVRRNDDVAVAIVQHVLGKIPRPGVCAHLTSGEPGPKGIRDRALHNRLRPWCSCMSIWQQERLDPYIVEQGKRRELYSRQLRGTEGPRSEKRTRSKKKSSSK